MRKRHEVKRTKKGETRFEKLKGSRNHLKKEALRRRGRQCKGGEERPTFCVRRVSFFFSVS